ncbi:uncharacterized protein A1O9_11735 [Exophiala aquamarina CBS 119918]|uniref:FAD/NAD(P)-binding domain-containing protein n=1 Tax=Exophiala aquamarina CBS 119918 TaxID=1182545 RepID=A0A072NW44_9EURO|nr:uncharacterized protein A1O9_11735 [Exophiala aquamarina CBS 119918]KEF52109.1 hypothetical protein A1O9_11735 [Exophiala aquamarina CBS 119918]
MDTTIRVDVLVVGAGLSGMSILYRLRKLGLKAKVLEAGANLGGVWHWNRYPGARVDSEWPYYQLSIPEVYRNFDFTERFPSAEELRAYMQHIDKALDLKKDIVFNQEVIDLRWNQTENEWFTTTKQGITARSKYIVLCTGPLHRRYMPSFPGLEAYKGALHHTSFWPDNVDVTGKRVALIGVGATGIQVAQALSKQVQTLTVFMRRPSYCLPMGQRKLSPEEQQQTKARFETLFQASRNSYAGFPGSTQSKGVFDVSEEEREKLYEELWEKGGFAFIVSNFNNWVFDKTANRSLYEFWAKKTRLRINNARKRDILVPVEPPFWFGTKRCPLEQDYYESMDRNNVNIVDLKDTPIKTFNEKGVLLDNNEQQDYDIIIMATGFDSFTGSLTSIGLKNREGIDLAQVWQAGIKTYLGVSMPGFPNTFAIYTPQAPAALTNGPTLIETQSDFVASAIEKLEAEGARQIEATVEAADAWDQMIEAMNAPTLFPLTNSWWNTSNVPGKKIQNVTHLGGIKMYGDQIKDALQGWKGFHVTPKDGHQTNGVNGVHV